MNRTKIPWVKNPDGSQGFSWNPITGCLNGCEYCYARKLANTRLRERYLANQNVAYCYEKGKEIIGPPELMGKCDYSDPFYPRWWEDRLEQIKRPPAPSAWANNASYTNVPGSMMRGDYNTHAKAKAKGIFTCDMSDLFGIGIPEYWTRQVLDAIRINGVDRFYLLTKQPQNLIKFSPFPDNCWIGVSATDNGMAYDASCNLASVKARIEYISFEPLLGRISPAVLDLLTDKLGVQWVIIGAQTKPYKPPKIEWVREIVEACDKAGVKVFLRNNLKPLITSQGLMRNFYWRDLRSDEGLEKLHTELRQELPVR